jgi:hypothetical protein
MSKILISGINKDFDPLQKPGCSLYFNTITEGQTGTTKYKIINQSEKDSDDYTTIPDSVIFNNIYSHEINENDIPLVEYYNLLIEVKSTTTQTNSTIEVKSTTTQTNQTNSTIEANSIKPKIFDKIKKGFLFKKKSKEKDIMGIITKPIDNINEDYYSLYPPDYKGPFFSYHAIDNTKINVCNDNDIQGIEAIALAWNNYISNIILKTTSNEEPIDSIKDNFVKLNGALNAAQRAKYDKFKFDFIYETDGTDIDDIYKYEYRPYNLDNYIIQDSHQPNTPPLKYVNKYGYPLYRAYDKHVEILKNIISPQIITRGGFDQSSLNGDNDQSPLNGDNDQDLLNGDNDQSPSAISTESQHQITCKYAWNFNNDGQITRFNGYYDMNYDRIKKDIFEHNKNTNMNIKFFIFQKEVTNVTNKNVTIIILKTSDNKIDPIIVTSSEAFLKDNIDKLENKIIAKISTTTDTTDTTDTADTTETTDITNVEGDTYILFNVDIIETIKDAKIYKEEDKYKYDFVKLNDDLKKIIEYYNTISKLSYFITYSKIEKQLNNFKKEYNNKNIQELINIYKEELRLRISICDNILASSSIDNNIKKYKDLLDYTYKNIDTYHDKTDYFERINKCVPLLIDRVRYYGENFIY